MNTNAWDFRNAIIEQLGEKLDPDAAIDLSAHTHYTLVGGPVYVQWAYTNGRAGQIARQWERIICPEFSALMQSDMIWFGEWLHQVESPVAPEFAYAFTQCQTKIGPGIQPHRLNIWMDINGLIHLADPDRAARNGVAELIQPISTIETQVIKVWVH